MSRASDLCNGLVTELIAALGPDQPVQRFLVPRFKRAELQSGPRVVVRIGSRALAMDQGPDTTDVIIEVGVVGLTPLGVGVETTFDSDAIALSDTYDALLETLIALWMHGGALARGGIANHYPISISQAIQFDPENLYSDGIYLSVIQITYRDSEDEE